MLNRPAISVSGRNGLVGHTHLGSSKNEATCFDAEPDSSPFRTSLSDRPARVADAEAMKPQRGSSAPPPCMRGMAAPGAPPPEDKLLEMSSYNIYSCRIGPETPSAQEIRVYYTFSCPAAASLARGSQRSHKRQHVISIETMNALALCPEVA